MRRWLRTGLLLVAAVFIAIQFVPYGWQRTNPPVVDPAPWPSAEAEAIARTSCYDCHSSETEWPVQAHVAPFSWLVIRDVDQGRDELNFSEWDDHDSEADDAAEAVADGSMPPDRYTLMHGDARLTDEERDQLIAALEQMDEAR